MGSNPIRDSSLCIVRNVVSIISYYYYLPEEVNYSFIHIDPKHGQVVRTLYTFFHTILEMLELLLTLAPTDGLVKRLMTTIAIPVIQNKTRAKYM